MINHTPTTPSEKLPAQAPREREMATDGAGLTAREHEVLPWLEAGKTDREIADALGISMSTVRTHVRSIRRKLGMGHRGWVHLPNAKQNDSASH